MLSARLKSIDVPVAQAFITPTTPLLCDEEDSASPTETTPHLASPSTAPTSPSPPPESTDELDRATAISAAFERIFAFSSEIDASILGIIMKQLRAICSAEDPTSIYHIFHTCGQGASGKVHIAALKDQANSSLPKIVALKEFDLRSPQAFDPSLIDEIRIMRDLDHPNTPRFIESYLPDENTLWIMMDLVDGYNIRSLLNHNTMTEQQVATVCRELCDAIVYLHSNSIVHRDIKGPNLMINSGGQVKLVDYGAATSLKNMPLLREIGTRAYMAPETFNCQGYDEKADIWSLGITVLYMAFGHLPWYSYYCHNRILGPLLLKRMPKLRRGKASDDLHDFLSKCLCWDAKDRASAAELRNHKFLEQASTIDCLIPLVDHAEEVIMQRLEKTKTGHP